MRKNKQIYEDIFRNINGDATKRELQSDRITIDGDWGAEEDTNLL